MKSTIHLIRHGITEGNLKKWFYGWTDIPLAEEGVTALRENKANGIYPVMADDTKYYTSGMIRTEQTFKEIFGDLPHEVLLGFKEMNFGSFEKLTYEDLKDKPEYIAWMSDKSGETPIPNGESRRGFYVRVNEAFKELINLHRLQDLAHRHSGNDATSVCVCHGGVIGCIMMGVFKDEEKNFVDWIPDPGRGYSISLEDGKCVGYEKI